MSKFWKDKKVVVTGADGFIGSHLVELLAAKEAKVRAFVYYNSFNSMGWLEQTDKKLLQNIEFYPGDVRDYRRICEGIKDQEVVFHLASLIAIPYSYHAPDSYVQTNILGTLNVLNACRDLKIPRVIHTSTSEVYGTAQYVPIDEKHPLQGQSPYSATKIGADKLVESYFCSFNLPVSIVRPFNTYGPRQSARAVIPTIISQLVSGVKEIKLGNLSPSRDFNYVADTASGFLYVAQSQSTIGRVINIGSGREISIGDLVKKLITLTGSNAGVICEKDRLRPDKSEVDRLLANIGLARELTGWEPEYTLDDGLKLTIDWIRDNLHVFKTDRYNI